MATKERTRFDQIFARFESYHRKHPEVFRMFIEISLKLVWKGCKEFSADAVLHRIRWYYDVERDAGAAVTINNDYAAMYSRLWAAVFPHYRDLFKRRTLSSKKRKAHDVDIPEWIEEADDDNYERFAKLAHEWRSNG